jgi:DMSO/TMAO reductase YedYZ heme-binding membrane subunit
MTRGTRHLLLAAGTAGAGLAAWAAGPAETGLDRLSMMLSWVCLVLFAAVLVVGPAHTLRTGRLVGNHLPRRDLGIWCALTGLAHLALAFKTSMNPSYMQFFVHGASAWPEPAVRSVMYRWAVLGSLVVAALFALLLLLSNNLSLRVLGPRWWKRLQRSSYLAFALTVAHSVAFQIIESRTAVLVIALAVLTLAVLAGQYAGWSRLRANSARASR